MVACEIGAREACGASGCGCDGGLGTRRRPTPRARLRGASRCSTHAEEVVGCLGLGQSRVALGASRSAECHFVPISAESQPAPSDEHRNGRDRSDALPWIGRLDDRHNAIRSRGARLAGDGPPRRQRNATRASESDRRIRVVGAQHAAVAAHGGGRPRRRSCGTPLPLSWLTPCIHGFVRIASRIGAQSAAPARRRRRSRRSQNSVKVRPHAR